jgi:DNA-binding HxlR family transcriptional regulator
MGQKWETASHRAWKDTKNWVVSSFIAWILAFIITVGSGVLAAIFIPTTASIFKQSIYGAIGAVIALASFLVITYVILLLAAPYKQRDEARLELNKMKVSGDEISRVIKQLSELNMQIKGDNKNYSYMLMECADKLAVGGIIIDPATPAPVYRILADHKYELEERPLLKGMVHSQLLGFLRQLVVEGIVERKNIGTAPYYEETFYLTEFGRQVINRMKRLKEKKTYELDLVKLFHDGKDVQAKLKRVQEHWNASDQVTAELYFEVWFTDVSHALQNTKFISVWNDNKVVNYQKDSLSDYIEASDRALNRLDSIVKLASRKEDSQS